jgi:hypothetical protein
MHRRAAGQRALVTVGNRCVADAEDQPQARNLSSYAAPYRLDSERPRTLLDFAGPTRTPVRSASR